MAAIDRLPPGLRALVNEYGFQAASAFAESCDDMQSLEVHLSCWREQRQREWLATDYLKGFDKRRAFAARRARLA